jgi:hypothetical protein
VAHLKQLAQRLQQYREKNRALLDDIHGKGQSIDENAKERNGERGCFMEQREIVSDGFCFYFESVVPGLFELILFLAVIAPETTQQRTRTDFEQHMRQLELLALFCPLVFIRAIVAHVTSGEEIQDDCSRRISWNKLNSPKDISVEYISFDNIYFDRRSQYTRGIAAMEELDAKLSEAMRLMAPHCRRIGRSIFVHESEIDRNCDGAWWNDLRTPSSVVECEKMPKNEKKEACAVRLDDDVDAGLLLNALNDMRAASNALAALLHIDAVAVGGKDAKPGVSLADALFAGEFKCGIFSGLRPLACVLRDARMDIAKHVALLKLELGKIVEVRNVSLFFVLVYTCCSSYSLV